ncbi:hypothetical protein NM203_02895 [Mycolicibacterium sp. CAU 1645]|uniref:Uncharacterized protein n=1 Tax=Mycolicibacterium arenosum TaxID=2952157 RepID=A0ABT1LW53_9MYCO|nr:hypothetical protein [Mycolicibacterium sp. CAU 1645]MCP9271131.1 hypothetical protein [Mycolicibacterium sp. CAU 1645]
MTGPLMSGAERSTVAGEQRAAGSPPHDDRRNGAGSVAAWVGIVAGVVFIVAVVFFSGFFIGRSSSGSFRVGYHQPGMMMGPSQMGPGQMGPGGMTGPDQWPTTTAPTTPRP